MVAAVLACVAVASHGGVAEWLGSLAVLFSFMHGQVSDRMAERDAARAKPETSCSPWSLRYFVAKEALWLFYFGLHRSYAALAGVFLFLVYPIWRRVWRSRHPLM